MILAGDIGGTKTSLALASAGPPGPPPAGGWGVRLEQVCSYESQRYSSLEAVVEAYLAAVQASVEAACFGVAGPVFAGEATITNLPWRISEAVLSARLGGVPVRVINDLTALAYAVPVLEPEDLAVVQEGSREPTGAIAILAPGTGLGTGYLCWAGDRYRPGASEGGHADFAPADELQMRLWARLRREYGHVSWERLISGPGLHNIYRFLRQEGPLEPEWLTARLAAEDPGATISALALAGADPVCRQALEVFVSIMGAQAGNLALTLMATGGVYLGGGIPPKILPGIQGSTFTRAFRDKGRLSHVVQRIPVWVIQNAQRAPLVGAASCVMSE